MVEQVRHKSDAIEGGNSEEGHQTGTASDLTLSIQSMCEFDEVYMHDEIKGRKMVVYI